jgi:hypothetical protein
MVCFCRNAKEASKIALNKQRHLINNFKLANFGAVIKVEYKACRCYFRVVVRKTNHHRLHQRLSHLVI